MKTSTCTLMQVTLDILVEALGRVNFGCVWDYKGLTSPVIKLNGEQPAQIGMA